MVGSSTKPHACVGTLISAKHVLILSKCVEEHSSLISARAVGPADLGSNASSSPVDLQKPVPVQSLVKLATNNSTASEDSLHVVILQEPLANVSPVELLIGSPRPATIHTDTGVTLLTIDLDNLRLSKLNGVVYVDKSVCEEPVCVLPEEVEAREVLSSRGQWSFLLKVGAESVSLLGLGGSSVTNSDGIWGFNWLPQLVTTATFKRAAIRDVHTVKAVSKEILGPPVAKLNEYSNFVVGLRLTKKGKSICSGTIISPRFVLSAAHCSDGVDLKWVSVNTLKTEGGDGKQLPIRRVARHPNYVTGLKSYDFLVIELARSTSLKSIKLEESKKFKQRTATVFGYGSQQENGPLSTVLRSVQLPIGPSNDICGQRLRLRIDESMMCAGGEEGKDSCQGDSGGPLILEPGTARQRQVGVVSFGKGCGLRGGYGIYAAVSAAMDFIKKEMSSPSPLPTAGPPSPGGRPLMT
ncbi:hypothetical protein Poli38472_011501 [Pythium oligandrum]|uniref:Peptidase S1 domain-containing protein n=1 Tax=Pythium oligandrum TaxID=41045 RepID=A0A8K1FJ77_PYTOL|nr:hypothetical protein Poli38472_011501 [Pythium oligandrum]|eukprot:TMW64621.1 hypothetical protein Poli38472_011501 [Pythium oligandrum]